MPTPNQNESKEDFIARCIPEVMGEGYSQDQAAAICYTTWDDSKKANIKRAVEQYHGFVTCSNCKGLFGWTSEKEVKMGYVKCPFCGCQVDQTGKAF